MFSMIKLSATNQDGRKGHFTKQQWEILGNDKAGWALDVIEPPEEVANALKQKSITSKKKKHGNVES